MSEDIRTWLEGLGLGQYAGAFEENAIDWDVLADLTDADLRELGRTALGHRKKLLRVIRALSPGVVRALDMMEPASEELAGPEAERRQLTVMFCDLVDSSALAECFDPEDLGDI